MISLPHASVWFREDVGRNRARRDAQRFKSVRLSERRRRWVIGSGVVFLHISILAFLAKVSPRWHSPAETASTLVLLDLTTVPPVPKLTAKPVAQPRSTALAEDDGGKRQSNPAEGRESSQIDQTPQSGSTEPLIDWSAELETIAKAEAPELLAERLQKCHDAEMHGRSLVGCGKVKTPDIWKWDTGKAGLAGLLSIGKRQADGHIFDNMRDPDRDPSSVPDIAALQEGPHRPLPLAFDSRRGYFTH
jgi:hypothetical protein